MSDLPYSYQNINIVQANQSPSTIHTRNTKLYNYYFRRFYRRCAGVYKFTLPRNWDKNFFKSVLLLLGHIAVFKTNMYGLVALNCGLYGYNLYHQPSRCIISNPLIRSRDLQIGYNTEIIKIHEDYTGLAELISYYADLSALLTESVIINSMESRVGHVFVGDKTAVEGYKEIFDQLISGSLAAFATNKINDPQTGKPNFALLNSDVKSIFVAPEVQTLLRNVEYCFDRDIGIPTSNIDKKQRMTEDEVNGTNIETAVDATLRLDTMRESMSRVRQMFGIPESELNVSFNFDPLQKRFSRGKEE